MEEEVAVVYQASMSPRCLAGMEVPFTEMAPEVGEAVTVGFVTGVGAPGGVSTRRCLRCTQHWIWISGKGHAGAGLKVVSAD